MLDIEELEQQWKRYNRKRKKPFYLISLLILILSIGTGYVIHNKIKLNDLNIKHIFISSPNIQELNTSKKISISKENSQKVSKKIYLLNDFIKEMNLVSKHQTSEPSDNLNPLDQDDLYIEKDISKPIIKKKRINIIKVSNNNAYRDVERRFKRSHNINDSIFLANMYYKKRNYKKAIYWSMQTNKLDNNIEESWLIFAKSKVKLGKTNEAIRVLKAYIKRSNSYEARKLLKKIMNN